MNRPQLISSSPLHRMLQAANEASKRCDFQQSIELLERASQLAPANPKILFDLGWNYGLCYQFASAENSFEKAVRVAPNKAEVLAAAGRAAIDIGDHSMAERFFLRALAQPKVAPGTVARLAELYERLHRPQDAAGLVERALRLDSGCALARLIQARLHRRAGRLAEAEQVLRPALTAANLEWRARSYYELGAILDLQGRYDDAMAAFLEVKTALRSMTPPSVIQSRDAFFRHLEDLRSNVSGDMLARWFETSQELLQPPRRLALLAGHARSGTTLLEQVMDSHPDIVSAEETYIFFDNAYTPLEHSLPPNTTMLAGLDGASAQTLRRARERYFQSMSRCLGLRPGASGPEGRPLAQRLLIDKNPNLQPHLVAFVRFFPDARLIVVLRDPRDVVLSCFMQPHVRIGGGTVNYLSLDGAADAYRRFMGLWRTLAPLLKNPWREVRYEDMVENLESVARQTLDFLGVPWDARVLDFTGTARKKLMHAPTYADVVQPVYQRARGRWRHYQKYLEPHLHILEPFVRAFGYE